MADSMPATLNRIDSGIAYVTASDAHVRATVYLSTREAADELAAEFPKSNRLHVTTLTYPPNGNYRDGSATAYTVTLTVKLAPDATTGAVNETGLRRTRSYGKHARRIGLELQAFAVYSNSMPNDETLALFA